MAGAVRLAFHHSDTATFSKPTNYLTSDTSWRDYNSTQFGFKQSFPGNPTASNSSIAVQGIDVPITTYERDNNEAYYATEAIAYPADFDMSDVDARLEGALNGSIQNTKGAVLTSSSFTELAGHRAIKGVLTVTRNGQTLVERETAFLKGNNMYLIITSGASEDDFNQFVNSFQFT